MRRRRALRPGPVGGLLLGLLLGLAPACDPATTAKGASDSAAAAGHDPAGGPAPGTAADPDPKPAAAGGLPASQDGQAPVATAAAADLPAYAGELRPFGPPGPDGGPLHPILRGWFFRPAGPAPAQGFPCVAVARLAGYRVSAAVDTLTPEVGVPYRLVHEAGIAVFMAHLPVARSDALAALPARDQTATGFDPAAGSYGPPYPRGAGTLVPFSGVVGEDWPGPPPPGLEAPHPWRDPRWLMPEKSAVWVVQHLRHHGVGGTGELPVDPDRLGLDGSSSGGAAMLFAALMPDLAGQLGGDDPASAVSSRVAAVRVGGAPTYWPLFRRDGRGVRFRAYHFPRLDSAPAWDEPADRFDQATGAPGDLALLGAAIFGSDLGPESGLTARNRGVQLYLAYNEPSHPRVLATPDRWRPPFPMDLEQGAHPVSQAYILKALYPDNTRLVLGKPEAEDPEAATTGGGVAHDALITDKREQADDQLRWWRRVLWSDG